MIIEIRLSIVQHSRIHHQQNNVIFLGFQYIVLNFWINQKAFNLLSKIVSFEDPLSRYLCRNAESVDTNPRL